MPPPSWSAPDLMPAPATPAAFGAHVQGWAVQSEIARQFIEGSGGDVILGCVVRASGSVGVGVVVRN